MAWGEGGVTVAKKSSQTSAIDSLYETNHEAEIPQHDVYNINIPQEIFLKLLNFDTK